MLGGCSLDLGARSCERLGIHMPSKSTSRPDRLSVPLTPDLKARLEALSECLPQGISATNIAALAISEALPLLESRYLGAPLPDIYRLGIQAAQAPVSAPWSPPPVVAADDEPEPLLPEPEAFDEASDDGAEAWEDDPLLPEEPGEMDEETALLEQEAHEQAMEVEAMEAEPPAVHDHEAEHRARIKAKLAELLERGVPVEDAYEMARASVDDDSAGGVRAASAPATPEDVDPFRCKHGVRFDSRDPCAGCAAEGY